jgi:hypothetical protein
MGKTWWQLQILSLYKSEKIDKTRHLKYDTNYKQYENRSYLLSEFFGPDLVLHQAR